MITVQISENTPYEALMATSVFIKQLASIYHPTAVQKDDRQLALPLPTPDKVLYAHAAMQTASAEDDDSDVEDDTSAGVQVPGAELDIHGLPWDERIHASSKAKTKSGEWRGRRNVDEVVVRQVEAELRNRLGLPAQATSVTSAIPAAPKAPALIVPVAPPAPAQPVVLVAPPAPEAPVVLTAPIVVEPPVVLSVARSYAELTSLITKVITASPLKQAAVLQAVQAEGFANVPVMANAEPADIGRVYARIERL